MPDITALVPAKTAVPTPQTLPARGVIVTAPAALTDPTVRVVIPSHSTDYALELRWVRQGASLPAAGADCKVMFDETGEGIVVWWAGTFVALAAETEVAALTGRVSTLEADRRVRGTVSAAGAITSGAGFSVSKTGTGTYVVTFTVAFSTAPSVLLGKGSTAGVYDVKPSAAPATTGFTALTYTVSSGASSDAIFHFIAEGAA